MTSVETNNRKRVLGRVAQAEMCCCGNSVIFSLGALSLRLDLAAVEDIASTLQRLLALADREAARSLAPAARGPLDDSADGSN